MGIREFGHLDVVELQLDAGRVAPDHAFSRK
jgi:hypothetical protein